MTDIKLGECDLFFSCTFFDLLMSIVFVLVSQLSVISFDLLFIDFVMIRNVICSSKEVLRSFLATFFTSSLSSAPQRLIIHTMSEEQ